MSSCQRNWRFQVIVTAWKRHREVWRVSFYERAGECCTEESGSLSDLESGTAVTLGRLAILPVWMVAI